MFQHTENEIDRTARWGRDERHSPSDAALVEREAADWRLAAATIGLPLAGVMAPPAIALVAAMHALPWPPLALSALIGLLALAPAGVGLAAALVGLPRVARRLQQTGSEAEQAILRVFAAALLFGHALVLAAVVQQGEAATNALLVAALGLIAAWFLLASVIRWPTVAPRRYGAIVFDALLISAFLHFGESRVAGWYPLYVAAIFYAGLRFGAGALLVASVPSVLGFTAVVLTTAAWREQPALSAGLILALAALPAILANATRRTAPTRPAVSDPAAFAPPVESFNLRALIVNSLAPLQGKAGQNGLVLRWRVDPRLPNRLRGRATALARIVETLADYAIGTAEAATVRVAIGGAVRDGRRLRLDLRVDGLGDPCDPAPAPDEVPLALQPVQRLAALAGGRIAITRPAGHRLQLAVTLPLAIEPDAVAPSLDLDRRPALIVTEDDELARGLAEPLATWNAEPRWVGDVDEALAELAEGEADPARRALVLVDGRTRLLSALGLAHQAAKLGANAPFVLVIAGDAQIASLAAVDDGELDGFIPAPAEEALLANALYALPLVPPRQGRPPDAAPALPFERPVAANDAWQAGTVQPDVMPGTPIAAESELHPESAAPLDPQAVERLRALGGNGDFLGEVIETFRIDADQIMQRLEKAAATGDSTGFSRNLVALRRAAGPLGGVQLCELTAALQPLSDGDLHQHGAAWVERLNDEISRLIDALATCLATADRRRR